MLFRSLYILAVPPKCTITVDRRYIPGESGETAKKELEHIIEILKKNDPELKAKIKKTIDAEALETSEEEPIVKALKEAGKTVVDQSIRTLGFPYASDAWILSNKLNVPTVLFGPGHIDMAHKPNEFVEINELINVLKFIRLIGTPFGTPVLPLVNKRYKMSSSFQLSIRGDEGYFFSFFMFNIFVANVCHE